MSEWLGLRASRYACMWGGLSVSVVWWGVIFWDHFMCEFLSYGVMLVMFWVVLFLGLGLGGYTR
ncbi:Uncharacterised protein [Dermatophilus congolensis]|uniref:Uncharacterized protein n=1 Tax=Dermatophilus congolensis TaxID=1863 RepID=A0AA46BLD4_9MICO|nr:Uncharacterised protein [Dermatophilus congolensis]